MGHGIRAARTGAVIAGGTPRARSASMLARSQSSGLGYAGSTGKNWRWQAGSRRSTRTGSASGPMNLMLINVSTRKFRRAVRLPEGDVPAPAGSGVSKSAASRHFVALSAARMQEWMALDLSKLDLLVVQIDGIHLIGDLVLVAAIGIDGKGVKHPLGLIEGATENAAVVQALIDNLVARGLDPAVPRLFIIDGSKALSKAIRRSFGREALIQRCQIHKARNIMERLPKPMHAAVRRVLRQAWKLDDANKAEKLIRNLARRLEHDAPGVSGSILEGLDEILTVTRLGLPKELRRALACTNIVENVMSTVRRVCRNVKRWRSASMALRWTAAAMQEAAKGFRRGGEVSDQLCIASHWGAEKYVSPISPSSRWSQRDSKCA